MKFQFKHQKFQADAAKAVVDVFAGQPYLTPSYLMDRGYGQQSVTDDTDFTGWRNERIVPELSDKLILEHLQKVQRTNQIKPSDKLEGRYNLTIEMETGVGKTYTYIKTMYELNKHYGWSKFVVVVPSIAIREGVYKSFQVTQDHFAEEYGKKIRFFIYNSAQLTEIDRFALDSSINVWGNYPRPALSHIRILPMTYCFTASRPAAPYFLGSMVSGWVCSTWQTAFVKAIRRSVA